MGRRRQGPWRFLEFYKEFSSKAAGRRSLLKRRAAALAVP
ncbi:MAG: hypothetical protein [Olavius algarvensis spirochete endosymbiont]|nr:MAG: hypothetical protein [Olavius algarvensis spirochete endosymbiont]